MAQRLGGEVNGNGVLCPGPGHSDGDRSLSVKPDSNDSEGFIVYSHSGDDWKECRTHVRKKLGLPERGKRKGKGNSKNKGGGGDWRTLDEFIYRGADKKPYLKVRKSIDPKGKRQFPQFRWDGKGWIKGKPKGPKIPYQLPELLAAPVTSGVWFCEGEKDAENLAKLGFVATTASEGAAAKWDPALTPHFKDRHVVVLADADDPGRAYVQRVARAINGVAASVRVLDLYPERQDGSDVSDWLVDDTAGAKLAALAKEVPLWEPTDSGDDDNAADSAAGDTEIERLAKLKPLEYERERKAAAEKLDIRASILDRLVRDERARLGLDGGDDGLQGSAVSFDEIEPWPEPVDGAELLDDIAAAIRNHVVMSDSARDISALWVVHSYLIKRFKISPKLSIRSPAKRCGKTTLLEVLAQLVFRAWVTGSITKAALFRVIDMWHPTLLIDEVDTFVGEDEELRGILNHGHRYDGYITRTVGDEHEPRKFSVYAAVALSGIGGLADTLADRSVRADLKRRRPSEAIAPLRIGRMEHLHTLRRRITRWVADHEERIAEREPEMPSIIDREADNWHVLLAIADEAAGEWSQRARKAVEAAHVAGADDDASWFELLLGDIRGISKGKIEMPSADLVKALVAIEGRPWAEMGKTAKPMTQNRLARMLKPLGIAPKQVGPENARVRGYVLADFKDAFERYLAPAGASQPSSRPEGHEMGTSDISEPSSPNPAGHFETREKPNNDGLLDTWTVKKGNSGKTTRVRITRTQKSKSDDLLYDGPVVEPPAACCEAAHFGMCPLTAPGRVGRRCRRLPSCVAWNSIKSGPGPSGF
jgi:putative DNA primase/helicase